MAVTSLWHIEGRLKDLIDYVENPDKTVPKGTEDFFNVFSYVQNPVKTENGEYVSAVNCLKETALQQMISQYNWTIFASSISVHPTFEFTLSPIYTTFELKSHTFFQISFYPIIPQCSTILA